MNEYIKKNWEAIYNPPEGGGLTMGPSIGVMDPPAFVDNVYVLEVPSGTPGIGVFCANAGAANTLTIALPTALCNVGKTMGLSIAQTGTACVIAITGIVSPYGSSDADTGVYVLHGVNAGNGACAWVPVLVTAIASVTPTP